MASAAPLPGCAELTVQRMRPCHLPDAPAHSVQERLELLDPRAQRRVLLRAFLVALCQLGDQGGEARRWCDLDPVTVPPSAGISDILTHGLDGYLSRGTSPEDLGLAVATVLGNRPLRAALGQNARSLAVERFGLDTAVEAELKLLQDLLAEEE